MNTERLSPRYADIELWQPGDILDAMIEGQLGSVAAVRAAAPAIEQAALAIEARLRRQGRLIYAGAGTSGRLAVQDGAELMPTFSWPADRLLLLLAGGDKAMTQAVEGAEDDTARAAELIERARRRRHRRAHRHGGERNDPVYLDLPARSPPPRRPDGRHRQQPRHAAAGRGRASDLAGHRPRADRRLDPHERRHGAAHHPQPAFHRW